MKAKAAIETIRRAPQSALALIKRMDVQEAMKLGASWADLGVTQEEWRTLMRPSVARAFRSRLAKAGTNPAALFAVTEFFLEGIRVWGHSVQSLLEGVPPDQVTLLVGGLVQHVQTA